MTIRRRSNGQQPGTKSGRRPGNKPLVRSLCSSIACYMISFVRASEESFRTVVCHALKFLEGKRNGCFWTNKNFCVPFCLAPLHPDARHPAMRRPALTRLWYVRVLDSTGMYARTYFLVESKTRTYHSRVVAGPHTAGMHTARQPGLAGRDKTPAGPFAGETIVSLALQGTQHNRPRRIFGSTNNRNPIQIGLRYTTCG